MSLTFKQLFALLFVTFIGLLAATALQAWTGPTATAPGGNAAAPLNVGTSDQVKNAGLSVNALGVFGNSYFSGNVGIGAANPAQKLVVNGDSWLSGNLTVQDGNVGIGTANPAYKLDVAGTARVGDLFVNTTNTTNRQGVVTISEAGGYPTSIDILNRNETQRWGIFVDVGSVGDGLFGLVSNANLTALSLDQNGNLGIHGTLSQASDARLKTGVQGLSDAQGLQAIEALKPVSYTRVDEPQAGVQIGFLAQDVQKIFPSLVSNSPATTTWTPDGTLTLNYSGLIASLVKAVQEQKAEIDDLKAQIELLKSK